MRPLQVVLSAVALSGPVAATDIAWYRYTSGCAGSPYYTTYNAGNAVCYHFASGDLSMTSAKFNNLPSGAKGQVYTSYGTCATYAGETTSNGGCISGSSLRTGNWFYPWKKLARRSETKALTRHGVTYELPDGTIREVEVPLQQLDDTFRMVDGHDFEALAKLPDFIHDN